MSLLEEAKKIKTNMIRKNILSNDELELVIGYIKGEISLVQLGCILKPNIKKSLASQSSYASIVKGVRQLFLEEKIKIIV